MVVAENTLSTGKSTSLIGLSGHSISCAKRGLTILFRVIFEVKRADDR